MSRPMHWIDDALSELGRMSQWGYRADGPSFTEPAALAATALLAHGREAEASFALEWLCECQSPDGSLGVSDSEPIPNWPTGLAVLAWRSSESLRERATGEMIYAQQISRAIQWTIETESRVIERSPSMGHDSTLVGWSWAEGTHGWVEPTATHVIALKSAGHADHPRTREAVRLLLDRICPDGGCNYGNTTVLGNELVPHLQPSGLALLALADEADPDGRIAATVDYARRTLTQTLSTASVSYALMGVTAHGRRPDGAEERLEAAWMRCQRHGASAYRLALLLLAARTDGGPFVTLLDKGDRSHLSSAGSSVVPA